jgi:1,4-dihydroxy-2-naphthoate octaprenyltransferase
VGTGVAIAEDGFALLPMLAALLGALCLQIGANFANDAFDFHRGADTAARLGPPRVTQTGLLSSRAVFTGMWVAFALAFLAGVYLVYVGGWPIVIAGLASIVAAIIYTGGPWPIGYHALGDVFTFIFFGVVAVVGTAYVQTGEATTLAWLASIPMGCTVTAILVVNNLRDLETDRTAEKTTLAVLLGDRGTRAWYTLLILAAYASALLLPATAGASPFVLLVLASLPFGLRLLRAVLGGLSGRPLNPVLAQTARFDLAFGVLLATGLALGA